MPAVLAVVFDFDDTLAPDSTTRFLRSHGIDTDVFWGVQVKELVARGFDPTLAYLKLILDLTAPGGPLEGLKEADLSAFGATLDEAFYPGLPQMFDDLRASIDEVRDVSIEFYIISGGLRPILMGSHIVQKYFKDNVYACELDFDGDGRPNCIRRAVTFTEKTRYLFEINKGIERRDGAAKPYSVNEDIPESERRIPFDNIIYVGDGLTDIPCFSLVRKNHGTPFGVFDKKRAEAAKRALMEFLVPDRVTSAHFAQYGAEDELGVFLRAAVVQKASEVGIRQAQA